MAEVDEKIRATKQRCEALKGEIIKIRQSLHRAPDPMGVVRKSLAQTSPSLRSLLDAPLAHVPSLRRVLAGHFGKVYAMHWAGDSARLVSASQDGKLIIWNAVTTNKVQSVPLRSSWVMTCAFEDRENNLVACGGLDNLCCIYNLSQSNPLLRASAELGGHDGYLSCCRFVAGPHKILTASGDSTCRFWDVERCLEERVMGDHVGDVMAIAVCPTDPNLFVSGSCDTTAKVWDLRLAGRCTHTLSGHGSDINAVAFFPDGRALGTGSDDASCRFFDLRCYGEVNKFEARHASSGVTSVAFSKSGRILFAGYDDYACNGWDTTESFGAGKPCLEFTAATNGGHENRVSCLGVAPSGQALCTGSWDTFLKIWA